MNDCSITWKCKWHLSECFHPIIKWNVCKQQNRDSFSFQTDSLTFFFIIHTDDFKTHFRSDRMLHLLIFPTIAPFLWNYILCKWVSTELFNSILFKKKNEYYTWTAIYCRQKCVNDEEICFLLTQIN